MSDDLVKILRDYQAWMKDGESGGPSIGIDDIDGDQTFGAAADYIEALEAGALANSLIRKDKSDD